MSETSIDEVVTEDAFAHVLHEQAEMFFRLANSLLSISDPDWTRRHPYQLSIEADSLEAFLDDHGARYNRTYSFFRKLVASVRGLAMSAFALSHLDRRLSTYNTNLHLFPERERDCRESIRTARTLVQEKIRVLLRATQDEARSLGVELPAENFPPARYKSDELRKKLPRNLGEEIIEDEEQRIAEVASKYLEVCAMFDRIGVRRIEDEAVREAYLARQCSEERSRVYEATVHNLQSAYDTYVKNTVLEASDERLPRIRGHASAAFHLLEAVTHLAHFVERHAPNPGSEGADLRITRLVDRARIREVTLNRLLYWAAELMALGRPLAEELLPAYTNVQDLVVDLPDEMMVHARPAALIVAIVNHYGTPVQMEIGSARCDAGSILELMIAVGSNARERRLVFRGDENPLRDIGLLFEHGLGEQGTSALPNQLAYLRGA